MACQQTHLCMCARYIFPSCLGFRLHLPRISVPPPAVINFCLLCWKLPPPPVPGNAGSACNGETIADLEIQNRMMHSSSDLAGCVWTALSLDLLRDNQCLYLHLASPTSIIPCRVIGIMKMTKQLSLSVQCVLEASRMAAFYSHGDAMRKLLGLFPFQR